MMNIWLPRPRYLERIRPFEDGELIKVFLGQRRVGKSGLLRLVLEDWAARHPDRPRLLVDKELADWAELRTGEDLLERVHALEGLPGKRRGAL